MNSRGIILKILQTWDKKPGPLDTAIERELFQNPVDHRDRRFVFEIVYGLVRHRLTIDYVLEQFITDPKVLENEHVMRILGIGAYQILYMDRVPDHASVNESVNLTKLSKRTMHASGLVNATLRTLIKNRRYIKLPDPHKDLARRLSVEFSHPEWMVKRWLSRLGLARTKLLLSFNNEKPEVYLRRKLRGLSRQQFETECGDLCDSAGGYLNLYYRVRKPVAPEMLPLFSDGDCTIQASSSGWVTAMLDVRQGENVADLCCAPGGKSALAAELTGDSGMVCACEIRKHRMAAAMETFRRLHLKNIRPCICDGAALPFKGRFGKVLLDAPCTGSGVLHRHPEGRWIKNEADIPRLAELQAGLLHAASGVVAKGGILVYSTCSIEPEENENAVKAFLAVSRNFVLDKPPASIPETFITPSGYLAITPWEHKLDGMFAARFRRIS